MRRLGLDIGANSIGWCLTEDDGRIVGIGSRIFSDGRDPQSGTSLAVDRREARSARRRRDRYIGRRSAFLESLVKHGLMPADADEAKQLAGREPYELRRRALDGILHPYETGRALFHLNQRRGFKSNRKAERKSKDQIDGKIAIGVKALDEAIKSAGARTVGEFLSGRDTKRVRMNSDNQAYDFYPQRRHIEEEFDAIWAEQSKHRPEIFTEKARSELRRILFFQRPLKEQPVGVCTFLNEELRLPKAHPLFQERRLYEEVNQLAITTPGESAQPLKLDQRNALILELRGKAEVKFSSLAKRLKLQDGQSFNKASQTRIHLAGNVVHAAMSDKKRFGAKWAHLDHARQWAILERILDEENPDTLHDFLVHDCGLTDDQAAATAKTALPEGHGRLGLTATTRILDELRKAVITYDEAVRRCGWHHSDDRTDDVLERLPYYGEVLARHIPPGSQRLDDPPEIRWGKITNPTVHIGMRQLEKLVNAVIAVHGRPHQIVVELARELKLSEKDKEAHNRRIRDDTAAARRRSALLLSEGLADTGANRVRLRIWEELNPANVLDRGCPYCGKPIRIGMLFSGEADIDHILPYSKTLDDSIGNKVVAHRACNRAKGNLTPHGKWGGDPKTWEIISTQVSRLHKSKQWRFGPDAMERFERDGDFIARALTDTQYLSRLARSYLATLYPKKDDGSVYVIPGRMTAMLRRLWGLNDILLDHNYVENKHSDAPKNRLDHRHHAIDAAVVAVTTRSILQRIAHAAARAEEKDLDRMFEDLAPPWPLFREELRERLLAATVSHKSDHGRRGRPARYHDVTSGKLHDDTAYGLTGAFGPNGKTPVVVKRIPLLALQPKDIEDDERIRDETLRTSLRAATKGLNGKAFEQALAKFAKDHPTFKGIRRIRVLGERAGTTTLDVIPIRSVDGKAYKAYKGNTNARFQVWRMPDGSWRHTTISTFQAHQPDGGTSRPHPAAKKLLDLRQNDMIAVERDGGAPELMRVVKFSASGQVTLAAHNEAGPLKTRDSTPNDLDPFKYVAPTVGGLRKMKARQVRIDPLGRVYDPGPR